MRYKMLLRMNNWVKYLLAAALIANTVVLGLFLTRQQQLRPLQMPEDIIIETLHFDAEQQRQYALLRETHFATRKQFIQQFENNRRQLYTSLGSPDTAQRNAVLTAIAQGQLGLERDRAAHFAAVRGLCRPNQQAQFDTLMQNVAALFTKQLKLPSPQ